MSVIEAPTPFARRQPIAPAGPWFGGRIALIVAGVGLVGAALGGLYLGVAGQLGLSADSWTGYGLALMAVALLIGGALLVVGGLGYYVMMPGFMGGQSAWRGVGSHRFVIACTILIVMLAYSVPLAYSAVFRPRDVCSLPNFLIAALSVDVALLGITYFRLIRPGVMTARDLGLDSSRLPGQLGLGLLVGVGVLVSSAAIQATLRATGVQQTQLVNLQCVREFPALGFAAVVLAGGVIAPIAEELYFRGFVFRAYYQSKGPLTAYLGTSLLFSVLHLNLPALLPILVLSAILCYAYRRTGSIVPSIVGHAVNNSTAFFVLYFTSGPLGGG